MTASKHVNLEECRAAGLDPTSVQRIAKGLSRYALQAEALGLTLFGGSGSGTLRFRDDQDKGPLIVASVNGDIDGGAGNDHYDECGLLRGES